MTEHASAPGRRQCLRLLLAAGLLMAVTSRADGRRARFDFVLDVG